MKNRLFLLIILLIFLTPQVYAFEDYLILSDLPVSSINWSDDDVISATPLVTIDNRKSTIVLKAKKEGSAVLSIETSKGTVQIEVSVSNDKTNLKEVDGFTYYTLDKVVEWKK